MQDSQDRTRKRIKEDLKESNLAYNEYAETVLPRLKAKYTRKYAEVEVRRYPLGPAGRFHHLRLGAKKSRSTTICSSPNSLT